MSKLNSKKCQFYEEKSLVGYIHYVYIFEHRLRTVLKDILKKLRSTFFVAKEYNKISGLNSFGKQLLIYYSIGGKHGTEDG